MEHSYRIYYGQDRQVVLWGTMKDLLKYLLMYVNSYPNITKIEIVE